MTESPDRITSAVEACLAYTLTFESPVLAATDYIAILKISNRWSEDELAEVQRRVIDKLAKRASDLVGQ